MTDKERKDFRNEIEALDICLNNWTNHLKEMSEVISYYSTILRCWELMIKQDDMSLYYQLAEEDDGGYDELLKRLKEKENEDNEKN